MVAFMQQFKMTAPIPYSNIIKTNLYNISPRLFVCLCVCVFVCDVMSQGKDWRSQSTPNEGSPNKVSPNEGLPNKVSPNEVRKINFRQMKFAKLSFAKKINKSCVK